jgi:hypothetical protein
MHGEKGSLRTGGLSYVDYRCQPDIRIGAFRNGTGAMLDSAAWPI